MMRRLFAALLLVCCAAAHASQPAAFIYPPPETGSDQRHLYYWQLLEAALAANRDKYGDYVARPYTAPMTFPRAVAEVESGKGRVNIVARATNLELEKRLLPIPIPLDKGLLGNRLLLIMPDTQARIDRVRTLADLRAFSIGQASTWTDVTVLRSAGLNVVTAEDYEGLFQMLGAHRFDLFSRGVNEIEPEWLAHRDKIKGLTVERGLMLQYPMPRYFFVPRTPEGERMAARIRDGLMRLVATGEFERRYQAYKKLVLGNVSLAGRRVLRFDNPELSALAPLSEKYWWDDLSAEIAQRPASAH
ncbi:hypothetical protein ACDA63_04780 [Uliginosibacterium sp. sgz301328]|uniref:hypothetical protein n=1 Tax=Uliginosibacterium sp. sgz301328 TaxID=3243764 RepID=UPI00359E94A8